MPTANSSTAALAVTLQPCLLEFAQDGETFDCQIRLAAGWRAEPQSAGAMHGFNLKSRATKTQNPLCWKMCEWIPEFSRSQSEKEMVDRRFGPPAASRRRPDVCHRQMTGKRSCGWRALGNEQENERRDCLRPLVLTGLPFSGICSITAVCVEAPLNGPTDSRDTRKGKQAFSLWLRMANSLKTAGDSMRGMKRLKGSGWTAWAWHYSWEAKRTFKSRLMRSKVPLLQSQNQQLGLSGKERY